VSRWFFLYREGSSTERISHDRNGRENDAVKLNNDLRENLIFYIENLLRIAE